MRIAVDVTALGSAGGIGIYAEGLIAALGRAPGGHSLALWCGSKTAGLAAREAASPGTLVVCPGLGGRLLGRWGRLARFGSFPIEFFAGPVDVFHGSNYLLPAQSGRAALVVTVHDLSALHHPEWHPARRVIVQRVGLRRTLGLVDHAITDSEAIRAEVIEGVGVSPERVTAIPLGVSPGFRPLPPSDLGSLLRHWSLSPGGYLLFAGAIEPRKNLVRLVRAVKILHERRTGAPILVAAGPPGWRNRDVLDCLGQTGAPARCLGYVPREDLAALMAGCAAFVFPSLYEGFGLPVLEAMASGVPVVTSRGGALEGVAGGAAMLVDPLDVESIAAGIERVLDDMRLRAELRQKGLARAAQFSWERTARETLAVYEKAIAAKR